MNRIVFLDRATIAPQVVVRRPAFPHEWTEYPRTAPDQLADRLANDTTIAITNKVPLREPIVEHQEDLRVGRGIGELGLIEWAARPVRDLLGLVEVEAELAVSDDRERVAAGSVVAAASS